jgi:post-segregation antitoxin (ccd killing protein)
MPRMQIYLPDDLYTEVKARKLRVSELLQQAIRAELRREEQLQAMAEFVQEAIREYGEPSAEELAEAEEFAARIKAHLNKPGQDKPGQEQPADAGKQKRKAS